MLNPEPWKRLFSDWLTLGTWSVRSRQEYPGQLTGLFEFLQARGVERLGEVTRELLQDYRLHLYHRRHRGRTLAMSSQNRKLCVVKVFFRFLLEERYLLVDPAAGLVLPRFVRMLPAVPTEKEVRRLLAAPDVRTALGLRDRAILELVYSTGMRNTELRELCLDDIDTDRRTVRIRKGKGSKSRVVPLGQEAAYWLDAYLSSGRPRFKPAPDQLRVFLSAKKGPLLTREVVSNIVTRAARKAGLKKRITTHSLRHAVATHMLRRGAGLRHLQEMLGHASAGTTQIYTRVEITDLRRVHRKCHPRERGRQAAEE
ncbi:recombinase XerD [bacterium CPR1]|nr:recombinase XerD [bacterium CPR1]